jgi:hypothetical protein
MRQTRPVVLILSQVHKSQGQTLDRVKVDLNGTFEKGQGVPRLALLQIYAEFYHTVAYVALSRCTKLEGLEVHNFSPSVVIAHPKYALSCQIYRCLLTHAEYWYGPGTWLLIMPDCCPYAPCSQLLRDQNIPPVSASRPAVRPHIYQKSDEDEEVFVICTHRQLF